MLFILHNVIKLFNQSINKSINHSINQSRKLTQSVVPLHLDGQVVAATTTSSSGGSEGSGSGRSSSEVSGRLSRGHGHHLVQQEQCRVGHVASNPRGAPQDVSRTIARLVADADEVLARPQAV